VVDDESYRYSRWKLPRGKSHPVKRSDVDALIERAAGLDVDSLHLHRFDARGPERYFKENRWPGKIPVAGDAAWLPLCSITWPGRDAHAPWMDPFAAAITIYAVPSAHRARLHELVVEHVLPDALAWAQAIAVGPETGWTERHQHVQGLADDVLVRAEY
jgi:hypothetical protein